jgi:hypothetical protein
MCSREAGIIVVVVFHGFRFSFFFFSFLLCFNFYIRDTCGSYWMFFYIYILLYQCKFRVRMIFLKKYWRNNTVCSYISLFEIEAFKFVTIFNGDI